MQRIKIVTLVYFLCCVSLSQVSAQPATSFIVSVGTMADDMYNVAPETLECLTCLRFSGQASNTQMIIAPAADASMGVEIKVSQNTGFYFDLGLLYAQAKCRYHFEDVFINGEEANYDSISSENKLTFNDFYLYSTLAFHFHLSHDRKFYIYAGVRPELVIHDFSHESGDGTEATAQIINGVIQSPVVSEYSFDGPSYIDHNANFDVIGGLGMRIGKPNSGRVSLELGGFNSFIRYMEYTEPSTKRAGLELKFIYAFRNRPKPKVH